MRFSLLDALSQKHLKKKFKLPQKKELIYYEHKEDYRKHLVTDFEVIREFESGSAMLDIWIEGNKKVELPIHSAYLKEMQDKNFLLIKDTLPEDEDMPLEECNMLAEEKVQSRQ